MVAEHQGEGFQYYLEGPPLDTLRPSRSGKPSLDRILSSVAAVLDEQDFEDLYISIRANVSRSNVDEAERFCELVKSHGIDDEYARENLDADVDVLLTYSAEMMVDSELIGLFCRRLFRDTTRSDHYAPGHVGLAEKYDVIVVFPATAHMVACIANGLAPSLASQTILAFSGPVLVVPSMNPVMLGKTSVRRNLERLVQDGYFVVRGAESPMLEVLTGKRVDAPAMPTAHALWYQSELISGGRAGDGIF